MQKTTPERTHYLMYWHQQPFHSRCKLQVGENKQGLNYIQSQQWSFLLAEIIIQVDVNQGNGEYLYQSSLKFRGVFKEYKLTWSWFHSPSMKITSQHQCWTALSLGSCCGALMQSSRVGSLWATLQNVFSSIKWQLFPEDSDCAVLLPAANDKFAWWIRIKEFHSLM